MKKTYVITSAQNNTKVFSKFFDSLKVYAKSKNAEILVIPVKYRNPNSLEKEEKVLYWDEQVQPFLIEKRKKLNSNILLCPEVPIDATAHRPLVGLTNISKSETCIFGHAQMALESVALFGHRYPKFLSTTGSCTVPNVSSSKRGVLAKRYHHIGAIVVEVVNNKEFHLRQITSDRNGCFYELDGRYTPKGFSLLNAISGLSMGDFHSGETDPSVLRATFGAGSITEILNPEYLYWNDIYNGFLTNPHTKKAFFEKLNNKIYSQSVEEEINKTFSDLEKYGKGRKNIIVDSNHNDFLKRWLVDEDWKALGKNTVFYLRTALMLAESSRKGGECSPFNLLGKAYFKGKNVSVKFLKSGESFRPNGVENGLHGHKGPNGSRGSKEAFSKIGVDVSSGHSHTPGIRLGSWVSGTSSILKPIFTLGSPSSWMHTHICEYLDGSRTLLSIINGKWRA
jgi:hypothetical protein